jgi:hypothetical protein
MEETYNILFLQKAVGSRLKITQTKSVPNARRWVNIGKSVVVRAHDLAPVHPASSFVFLKTHTFDQFQFFFTFFNG